MDVSLSWQPVAWRYVDAAGHLDDLAAVQQVAGQVAGNTITYEGVMPQVNESYRVIPNGLKHQLTLLSPPRTPAGGLSGEITLDYVGMIELPAGLVLYANGAAQAGDFVTDGPIEVRDGEGHPLLGLKAPVAYEAENRQEVIGGSYAVWREGESLRLAWRTPAAWLLAPERRYPVVLDPTVEISPPAADTFIAPGLGNYGLHTHLYVGHTGIDSYRALLTWGTLSGIPAYALIDDGAFNDVSLRLYQTGHVGDGGDQMVRVHSLTHNFHEQQATWNKRFTTLNWDTPGGDYGATLAQHQVDTSSGYETWSSYGLRDEVALWRTFLYGDPPGAYGKPITNGILLRFLNESGNELKEFASRENGTPDWAPTLIVDYQTGPRDLNHQVPLRRRVPSPDYFVTPDDGSYWKAVGLRAFNSSANYGLKLHRSPTYSGNPPSTSTWSEDVAFIVIDQVAPYARFYPTTYSINGVTGYYRIEYVRQMGYLGLVSPGESFGPYTLDSTSVIRLWTLFEAAGNSNCISIEPTSGDARLGVALFDPSTGDYFDRDDALVQAVASTAGSSVSINFTAPSSAVYGLLVWNEGSSSTTTFYIGGCTSQADDIEVFLPIILKD